MLFKSCMASLIVAIAFTFTSQTHAADEFKISGQEAKAYYGKFIYGEKKVANSRNKFWGYLSTDRLIALEHGKKASAALYLLNDGTYTFRYTEGPATGVTSFSFDSSKDINDIKGTWRVVGSNLELDGLAVATGIQIGTTDLNGKNITVEGIAIPNLKNIRSPGLVGKVILMVPTLSTHSIDNKFFQGE